VGSGFMINAWEVGTIVAVVAGVVGFVVVLRRDVFAAHVIPNGAFAGAAGASVVGWSPLVSLTVAAVATALGISGLRRYGQRDATTALVLVLALAIGSAFLSQSTQNASAAYGLLFGEILGASSASVGPLLLLGAVCIVAVLSRWRALLLSAVTPDVARAKGVSQGRLDSGFLIVVALATTLTVPVVGALLVFSLMVGPAAAAQLLVARPGRAMTLATGFSVSIMWLALVAAYATEWPVGFFVASLSTLVYLGARLVTHWRATHRRSTTRATHHQPTGRSS